MRFLSSPSDIAAALESQLLKCKTLRWAVAWATTGTKLYDLLLEHSGKIEQLTVGIHFYQTDPEFIEAFLSHPAAGFVMHPDGVFHPKLYFFDHGDGRWDCVIGSPNLTRGALRTNDEAAVHVSNEDVGAAATLKDVLATLDRYRRELVPVDRERLDEYRAIWKRQQQRLASLSGRYESHSDGRTTQPRARTPLAVPLFRESWSEYFRAVRKDPHHSAEGRLAVLEAAQDLFAKHRRFADMPERDRKHIAGCARSDDLDWLWFGSMKGAGRFSSQIGANNPGISAALDVLPARGPVSRESYESFVQIFTEAFAGAGTATATRLLAFKRPDYFVCLDSKNRRQLCQAFGVSQAVDLSEYWDKVVARILDSNWWNAPEPSPTLERRVWACRAAFLDVRFYEPG